MNKLSRPNYGLQQEIMEMVFRLREKKSSQLFKQPVNKATVIDYYERIKTPMDLSTIINKLKSGQYNYSRQVYTDLQLIISNCFQYNAKNQSVLTKARQFQDCIKTQWTNFQKQLKKKQINIEKTVEINEEVLNRLLNIQEKRKNRKRPNLQINLQTQKKNILPDYSILPALPSYLFADDKNDLKQQQIPEQLQFRREEYFILSQSKIQEKLKLSLDHSEIQKQFDKLSMRKLNKYKKILFKKIMWIQQKIIQKCLQKKKFRKMQLPEYLSKICQKGEIANQLHIRKIQMYVKQVTYWIQQYSQILSNYMKDKFIQSCKTIRKCILRVLRYKKIPKTTKITIQLGQLQNEQLSVAIQQKSEDKMPIMLNSMTGIGQQQSKRYESKMKQFRRMLYKDRSQSTKRDTKITIKNENGQFSIVDWSSETNEKRKINRSQFGADSNRSLETRQFDQQKRKRQSRICQFKSDQLFLSNFKNRAKLQIFQRNSDKMEIVWDIILQKKLQNEQLQLQQKKINSQFSPSNYSLTIATKQ